MRVRARTNEPSPSRRGWGLHRGCIVAACRCSSFTPAPSVVEPGETGEIAWDVLDDLYVILEQSPHYKGGAIDRAATEIRALRTERDALRARVDTLDDEVRAALNAGLIYEWAMNQPPGRWITREAPDPGPRPTSRPMALGAYTSRRMVGKVKL